MRHRFAAVLVVALVVLSGCNILGGGAGTPTAADQSTPTPTATPTASPTPTATPTATPAPTPTPSPTPSPTPTPAPGAGTPTAAPDLAPVSSVAAPPGLEGRDLANPGALVQSHRQALAGESYRTNLVVINSTRGNATIDVRNGTNSRLASISFPSQNIRGDYYYGGTVSGVRNQTTGEIKYGNGPGLVRFEAGLIAGLVGSLGPEFANAAEWHAVGARTVDGQDQVVFTATELSPSDQTQLNLVSEGDTASDVQGRMVVSSAGVIQRVTLTWTTERPDGTTFEEGVVYDLEQVGGVTVDQPGWLDGAPQVSATVSDENRLLAVDHGGGQSIEAGSTLQVGGFFGGSQNVTVDQQVGQGDTVYVYKTGSGTDASYSVSVNQRPSLPDDATAFSGTVTVRGTQGIYTYEAGVEIASE